MALSPPAPSANTLISRVFVVDDSSVQCEHAASLCREVFVGASVSMAFDGKQALDLLDDSAVDLMLIDLEMPVMDGIELIGEIARRKLSRSILIMSAKDPKLISSVGMMAEAGGLRVLGCYQKPITANILHQASTQFNSHSTRTSSGLTNEIIITADDLDQGIQNHHFNLHYQPKLTTKGAFLKGVEALARWNHPKLGPISPLTFIDAAENSGRIAALSLHLFDIALRQKAYWNQHGMTFSLAFNLSPSLLLEDELINRIEAAMAQYDIKPKELIFEVTENVMLGNVAKSLQTLTRLRLKGFGIALDDYGTGFANAEQLVRLPATELKLDRSLIHGIAKKPQLEKLISSTVTLAADLNLITVAEGVEDIEDFYLLKRFNIDQVQGYHFCRPLMAEHLQQWIKSDLAKIRASLMNVD